MISSLYRALTLERTFRARRMVTRLAVFEVKTFLYGIRSPVSEERGATHPLQQERRPRGQLPLIQRVVVQVELLQRRESLQARADTFAAQQVVRGVQRSESGQAAQGGGQAGELVEGYVQVDELEQRADLFRQRGDSVAGEVQGEETGGQ